MRRMKEPEEDLQNRLPVWEALSAFFLDTELQEDAYSHIVEVLKNSPYQIEEIEKILYEEVYPVCIYNMFSVAGEWSSFDPEWLQEKILKRNKFLSKLPKLNKWMIKEPWLKVRSILENEKN